jgi:hypothetical protein
MTDPRCDPNPTRATFPRPYRSRASWPTFTIPSSAMSVYRASPTWVLCSQTTAFDDGPWWVRSRSRVSAMCRSRTFHDPPSLRTMAR